MYPGCSASSKSTKWLREHMLYIIYFVEIQVSEDYLYNRNLGKLNVSHHSVNAVMFAVGNVVSQ